MKFQAIGYDETVYSLPEATEWTLRYGLGSPCDSFEVACLWERGQEKALAGAVRFLAEEGGRRMFTGVVDEYACVRDGQGGRLELSGRGMQALLLDNQALPVEYLWATAKDIIGRHVTPYGIPLAGGCALEAVRGFSVSAGQSEWSVVHDFACCRGGIVPRFDREGRLVLSPWDDSDRRWLGDGAAVTQLRYRDRRYGVLSQVVVRDRSRNYAQTVDDRDFQAKGGRCRRVVSVPKDTGTPAMRFSGEYQLRASRSERETVEVTVAEGFAAWPGELMEVALSGFGGNGLYRVRESVVSLDGRGLSTRLTLGPTDVLV